MCEINWVLVLLVSWIIQAVGFNIGSSCSAATFTFHLLVQMLAGQKAVWQTTG